MNDTHEAWYRQGWPWALIAIPFAAVVFGIFMIYMASRYPDDLVADDYYQDGMAINRHLALDAKARALGIHATAASLAGDRVEFVIEGAVDSAVLLNLFHVTDGEQDTSLVLYPEGANLYRSGAPMPIPLDEAGVWYVELLGTDNNWRVRTRLVTPATRLEMVAR